MRGLFKGMTSPMFGVAAVNALLFGTYGWSLDFQQKIWPQDQLYDPTSNIHLATFSQVFIAGSFSGFLNSFLICPIELAKIKIQNQIRNKLYSSPLNFLIQTIRKDGIKSCFRGLIPTLVRETPCYGVYFASFEYLERKNVPIILSGGIAGCLCWISTYPIDVVKTRIQNDNRYTKMFTQLGLIYKNEGYRSYKLLREQYH